MKRIVLLCGALLLVSMVILLGGCSSGTNGPDQTVGWAVGEDVKNRIPVVFKTVDGVHWQRISSDFLTLGLLGRDVSAPDNQTAWVVLNASSDNRDGKVLRTTDGGSTWQDVTPKGHAGDVCAIRALTSDIAWTAGKNGYIAGTTNGGKDWSTVSVQGQTADSIYTGIAALDQIHVWVSGNIYDKSQGTAIQTTLVRTRDGNNWEQLPPIGNETAILGIMASIPDTVRVVVENTTLLYHSLNGGETWKSPVDMKLANGDLNNVAVYANNIWTVGDYASFVYSTDGGSNWNKSDLPSAYAGTYLVAISAIGDKRLWIGGVDDLGGFQGGMLWSDDGGLSWNETEPATLGPDIWRISMVGGVK